MKYSSNTKKRNKYDFKPVDFCSEKLGDGICQDSDANIEVSEGPFHQASTFTQSWWHKSCGQEEEGAHRRKAVTSALQGRLKRIPLLLFHFYKWWNQAACRNEIQAVSVLHQSASFHRQSCPSRIPWNPNSPTTLLGQIPGNVCPSLFPINVCK